MVTQFMLKYPLLKTRECLKSWLAMRNVYMRDRDRLSEVLAIPEHVRWRYKNAEYMYADHIASRMGL